MKRILISSLVAILALSSTARSARADLYVSDIGQGEILKYSADGSYTVFASNLTRPYGLAVDSAGNLYAGANGSVLEFTPNGTESTLASGTGFYSPGLTLSQGNVFVSSPFSNGAIFKIDSAATVTTFATGNGGPIASDVSGDIFAASGSGNAILKYAPDYTPANGNVSTFATGLSSIGGLAFNSTGDLFAIDNYSLLEFSPNGTSSVFATNLPGYSPDGLAFGANGDLYVSEYGGTILQYAPDGSYTTFATAPGSLTGIAYAAAPEPSTCVLLGAGLVGLVILARRRLKA